MNGSAVYPEGIIRSQEDNTIGYARVYETYTENKILLYASLPRCSGLSKPSPRRRIRFKRSVEKGRTRFIFDCRAAGVKSQEEIDMYCYGIETNTDYR